MASSMIPRRSDGAISPWCPNGCEGAMAAQQGSIATIIGDAPVRRIDYWLWLLATGGTLIDGLAVFTLGVAMPLIIARFAIPPHMQGLLAAALVFGAVIGAAIGGPAADRLGRRPMMLLDMLIIVTG